MDGEGLIMAEWWEDDKKSSNAYGIWWMGTQKNAHRTCPDLFGTIVGFGTGSIAVASNTGKSIGWKTSISVIRGAGTNPEYKLVGALSGISWCFGSYLGGGIDALYQLSHNGDHLGTAIGDWFMETGDSIHNWYVNAKGSIHNWWEHEEHWWKS